jgi:hypothetical protein
MVEAFELVAYAVAVVVSFAVVAVGIPLAIKGLLYVLRKRD